MINGTKLLLAIVVVTVVHLGSWDIAVSDLDLDPE